MRESKLPRRSPACALTYREFGLGKLHALLAGLGLEAQREAATRLFDSLTDAYAHLPLESAPRWPSDITDDGTPFEFSVAFSKGKPIVRILAEAQRAPFDQRAAWPAALAVNERLRHLPGVDFERFSKVAALFAPQPETSAQFALWHGAELGQDGSHSFKVYLNPRVAGAARAPALVREALQRLDAAYVWHGIASHLQAGGELLYLSLDLSASAQARVKLYLAHRAATATELDALTQSSPGYGAGRARTWLESLTGTSGPFDARPILLCHAFRSAAQPAELTIHVPTRCYVEHDGEAMRRTSALLGAEQGARFSAAVQAMAGRPLETGRSLISYVSLRPEADGARVTTYLAPEAFAISAPRAPAQPPTPAAWTATSDGVPIIESGTSYSDGSR